MQTSKKQTNRHVFLLSLGTLSVSQSSSALRKLLTFQASPLGVIACYAIARRFHFLFICVRSSHSTAFLPSKLSTQWLRTTGIFDYRRIRLL